MTDAIIQGELDDLLALEEGLSDWEIGFIDSINDRLERGDVLTERQTSKLHEIWDRHCG